MYYSLPTYAQARKAIFDAITIDGIKFLDYIPRQLVESINVSEMKIRFKNGSILQCIGADSYETSLIGTNPYAIVFSEYSRFTCGSKPYDFARPILAANGGWCMMLTTPFGHNHAWHLWKVSQQLPDWKVILKKTSEIQHIDEEVLAQERSQMDPGLYAQEYECSFDQGVEGSYYGKHLEQLRQNNQIGHVPWELGLMVYTVWDIGVNDATTIIFFQTVADSSLVRIIDCYSNNNLGLDHYAAYLQNKPYKYGKHFAPHDIKVREWGGGAISRYEKARQIGLEFTLVDDIPVQDGIENVWTHFNKFWIDETKCRSLIDALENYRRSWNEERQQYDPKPVKSWANHYADSLRYLCIALHRTKRGLTSEEFDRKKAEALYGNRGNLPRVFQHDPRWDR